MNKRIDKKRQKRSAQTAPFSAQEVSVSVQPAAPVSTPKENIAFYIQYQNQEYLQKEIVEKVLEKCKNDGASTAALSDLSIYLKPEDKKAYFAYNGKNGFIDL